jgi:hypothetical protein
LESLGPWYSDMCNDLLENIDWNSEKVTYAWAHLSDQIPSVDKDSRIYSGSSEQLHANFYIWKPPHDIDVDQMLYYSIMLVLDNDQEITTCMHLHEPCDGQ